MNPHASSASHRVTGPEKAATCPVCRERNAAVFMTIAERRYWRCPRCLATFLDTAQHPSRAAEREEYDRHQNRVDDPNYQGFLKPALEAVQRRVAAGSRVLDYGCGPGPALGQMLADSDYEVELYDPLYRADEGVLQPGYDAITCTEVAEHFHHPAREFQRLTALLRPGGWLIVMTRFQTDDARFAGWHYRRDPTHVVFYRPDTFRHLAGRLGWQVQCTPPHLVEIQRISFDHPLCETEQMNTENRRNKALLTITLFAAFADGNKHESEREEIRRIAESLSDEGGPDLRALYQNVLLQKTSLEDAAAQLQDGGEKHLAYELAVGVCDADGRTTQAERAFLDRLKALLALPGSEAGEIEHEAEQVVAMGEAAAPATATAPAAPDTLTAPDESDLDQRILRYSILNGALEVLPQSWASMAIIPLQIRLVYSIGQDYGVALDRRHIKEFLATLGVGMTSQYVEQMGRKLIGGLLGKMVGRGVGRLGRTATGAAFSFATTYALGHVARRYYAGGRQMTTQLLKQTFDEQFGSARELQAGYAPQISERAQTLDMGEVLALTRGSGQP